MNKHRQFVLFYIKTPIFVIGSTMISAQKVVSVHHGLFLKDFPNSLVAVY